MPLVNFVFRCTGALISLQVAINPTNTIFDAKRLIGRKFSDATVQADMKHWPFTVIDSGSLPKLQVGMLFGFV